MNDNFFNDMSYNSTEIGTVIEDCANGIAKVYINILSISISKSKPFRTKYPKKSASNILNKDARKAVKGYTLSNFVKLKVPEYIADSFGGFIPKGSELLITFIGGDITKPRVIGRNM